MTFYLGPTLNNPPLPPGGGSSPAGSASSPAPECTGNEIDCILKQAWEHYKTNMISPDGQPDAGRPYGDRDRTDTDRDNDKQEFNTFSEGASYVLLRAIWLDDRPIFDKVWLWVKNNLQRRNIHWVYVPGNRRGPMPKDKQDHLFAWRYHDTVWRTRRRGQNIPVGGVLYDNAGHYDLDPAADADLDIAAALISAHKKWGRSDYLREAKAILKDIWDKETKIVNGKRVLLAGDTQSQVNGVNPSYFRWGYYKTIFAEFDPGHAWTELFACSYELVIKSADSVKHGDAVSLKYDPAGRPFIETESTVPVKGKVNLPPDWLSLTDKGEITDHPWVAGEKNTRFDGDAFRILFWIAQQADLDPQDQVAQKFLTDKTGTQDDYGPYHFLKQQLDEKGYLRSGYLIDGTQPWGEDLKNNAAYLAFFYGAQDFASAEKIYRRMMGEYDKRGFWGRDPFNYYEQNWAWFALALLRRGAAGLWEPAKPTNNVALPNVLPQIAARSDLPEGFYFYQTASKYNDKTLQSLDSIENDGFEGLAVYQALEKALLEGLQRLSTVYRGINTSDVRSSLYRNIYPKIAEKYTLLWLLNRGIANPQNTFLSSALQYLNNLPNRNDIVPNFWLAAIAMVLASELDDPELLALLTQAPFCFGSDCLGQGLSAAKITKTDKKRIYEKIYTYIIDGSRNPFLKAENLLMQGFLALDLDDPAYKALFSQVETNIDVFIDKSHAGHDKAIEQHQFYLRDRILDDISKPTADDKFYGEVEVQKALDTDVSAAQLYKAQILMVRSGKEKNETLELKMLEQACALINLAANNLEDIQYINAKRLMAEALARRAFILKNQKKEGYEKLFELAKTLLQDVVDWKKDYDSIFPDPTKTPKYLRQTAALANLWFAKTKAVEIGDLKFGSRTETTKQQQAVILKLISENLLPILADLDDEPILQADAKRLLGELHLRLAYTMKDLGASSTDTITVASENLTIRQLAAKASAYLQQADRHGSKLVKVEARFWLAKASLVVADLEPQRQGELTKVAEAQAWIAKAAELDARITNSGITAFAVPELKGSLLSNFYAIQGDIQIRQGRLNNALDWFGHALVAYDKNYDALASRADIFLWQQDYEQAAQAYQLILANDTRGTSGANVLFSDELAFDRAKLGLLELGLRKDRQYTPLEEFARQLIQDEAKGSPLRKRAAQALLELYRGKQEWLEKNTQLYRTLSNDAIFKDPLFRADFLRRLAEAYADLRKFSTANKILARIEPAYRREETELTAAEITMRDNEELPDSLIEICQRILQDRRQDNPVLALRALLALMEGYSADKDFEQTAAISGLLLGRRYFSAEQAQITKLFPQLDGNFLAALFNNIGRKPLLGAEAQVWSWLINGLMWERWSFAPALAETNNLLTYLNSPAGQALPEIERQLYLADAHVKLGDIYRYSTDLEIRNASQSRSGYQAAEAELKKMPAGVYDDNWNDVVMLSLRLRQGLANLELKEGQPEAAWDADFNNLYYLTVMKVPPAALADEIERTAQQVNEPLLQENYSRFSDGAILETRLSTTAQIPLGLDQVMLDVTHNYDTRTDAGAPGQLQSFYVGGKVKPRLFFDQRLSLEAQYKVDEQGQLFNPGQFSTPNLKVAAAYADKNVSVIGALARDFADPLRNTYYFKVLGNLGAAENPWLQARVGAEGSTGFFFYEGTVHKAYALGLPVDYSFDPAEVTRLLPHGLVLLEAGVTPNLIEYEIVAPHGYTNQEIIKRALLDGDARVSYRAGARLNLGNYGRLHLGYEGSYQDTELFTRQTHQLNLSLNLASPAVTYWLNRWLRKKD